MRLLPMKPRRHRYSPVAELVRGEKPVYVSTGMMADARGVWYLLDYETAEAVGNKDQRSSHSSTEPTVTGE